jgi:hypothetical protein
MEVSPSFTVASCVIGTWRGAHAVTRYVPAGTCLMTKFPFASVLAYQVDGVIKR